MNKYALFILFAVALCFVAFNHAEASPFSQQSCVRYEKNPSFTKAITVVATNMKYSKDQLCALEHLADIYVVNHIVYTPEGKEIPHVWVTLHYAEHSCQYFVRNEDLVVTAKNCYNTW